VNRSVATSVLALKSAVQLSTSERSSLAFAASAILFRISLALVTFEQIRPAFGIQLSDYCLLFSLLFYALAPKDGLLGIRGSIFPAGGKLILLGSVLAMINASSLSNASAPFLRLVILFAVFAPLAMIHSKGVRKNVIYLIFGITVNSFITILQASLFPGIADALSINPTRPDISDSGRFQGLTSHPNIIGLSAALALLLAIGALITKRDKRIRVPLVIAIIACALAALLSGSRTVFVCFVPSLLVLIFQKKRRKAAIGAVIGIALLWFGINYVAPGIMAQFTQRIDSSGLQLDSDYGRLWSAVYTVVEISQKPILGWGVDHLDDAGLVVVPWTGEEVGAHNTFLKFWHGAGLLGAIGFILLFALPARQIRKLLKENLPSPWNEFLRLALASYLLLFIVSNLGPFDYNRFLYMPLFVFAGFASRVEAVVNGRSVSVSQKKKKLALRPQAQPST
jgi:O-antigen ligase